MMLQKGGAGAPDARALPPDHLRSAHRAVRRRQRGAREAARRDRDRGADSGRPPGGGPRAARGVDAAALAARVPGE